MKNETDSGEPSVPELFADEIGTLGFSNGVVRLDLVSQVPGAGAGEDGRPVMRLRQRLVMPVEGFLRSLETQQKLVAKLEEAGVVRRREAPVAEGSVEVSAAEPAGEASEPVRSPNFEG